MRRPDIEERLRQFHEKSPRIDPTAYVSPHAFVAGDVRLGPAASVFPMASLRGDINFIEIGEGTNIQDNVVVHVADEWPAIIGPYCTVGHLACVHACTVGAECLIGIGAVILDGARIGDQCIIGAHALITRETQIPDRSMVMGMPAKVIRQLDADERAKLRGWAVKYQSVAASHRQRDTFRK
jgi:carbonic anhydrase/acetyltransferase-like protein (isoleucine patch superfamily)